MTFRLNQLREASGEDWRESKEDFHGLQFRFLGFRIHISREANSDFDGLWFPTEELTFGRASFHSLCTFRGDAVQISKVSDSHFEGIWFRFRGEFVQILRDFGSQSRVSDLEGFRFDGRALSLR